MSKNKAYQPRERDRQAEPVGAESRGRLKAATEVLREWRLDSQYLRNTQRPPKRGTQP